MRARTLLLALSLVCVVTDAAWAQPDPPPQPRDFDRGRLLVGAIGGSALGAASWWSANAPRPSASGLLLGVAVTSAGAAAGASLAAGTDRAPSFASLFGGAALGALAGMALTTVAFLISSDGGIDMTGTTAVVLFSVGQGSVTALTAR